MPKLDSQYRTLKSLHTIVVADEFVFIARRLPMGARGTRKLRNVIVIRGQGAAFAVRAEVLSWIEAESRRVGESSSAFSAIASAVGLRGIFEHANVVTRGNFANGIHIGWTSVDVDWKDHSGARRNRSLDQSGIQVSIGRVDIDENGYGSAIGDGLRSCEKAVGTGDYFVVGLHSERQQGQVQRGRSGAKRNAMLSPQKSANSRSKASTSGPITNEEFWQTRSRAGRISSLNCAYSVFRSRTATFIRRL